MNVTIEGCSSAEQAGWLDLRDALWPHCSRDEHVVEMARLSADADRNAQFVAYIEPRLPVGFAEASLRTDYVNGTNTSPVAFLEGIYVISQYRRQGIAAQLVGSVAKWAMSHGCREFASDALLENELSQLVHKALGFQETERVVFFRKALS